MLIPLLIGAGFLMMVPPIKSTKSGASANATSKPSNYQPAQPSQNYPWSAIFPPRVDNKNQPWYNGPAVKGADSTGIAGIAGTTSSVVNSLSSVWGDLSDMFGGDDDKSNLTSADSLPNQQSVASNEVSQPDLGSASLDQSDAVGSIGNDELGSSNYGLDVDYSSLGDYGSYDES